MTEEQHPVPVCRHCWRDIRYIDARWVHARTREAACNPYSEQTDHAEPTE